MLERVIGSGAGFAGDRTDAGVALVTSGKLNALALECLAERTLVPGLRARKVNPQAGADPRLERRLRPLIPVAVKNNCRIISNLGAANPAAAGRQITRLATELGCHGLKVAAVTGDDVLKQLEDVQWEQAIVGEILGAHAYLGADSMRAAVEQGANVIVTGRAADSALFSAEMLPLIGDDLQALAGATTVGHLLECSGQITGGNFEMPDGTSLSARDFADLSFPIATVRSDGSAELSLLEGKPGRLDALTCTLQLLYEVHDPAAYITPDAILDFTGIQFEEVAPGKVRMTGARATGIPKRLKVSGFVDEPGVIADVETGYAGTHALQRGQIAADTLRHRLGDMNEADLRIDLVGVDSTLGNASLPAPNRLPEVRVHISARCDDMAMAQIIEDEVYALSLLGPAGAGSFRSERRPCLAVVDGFIDRDKVKTEIAWEVSA